MSRPRVHLLEPIDESALERLGEAADVSGPAREAAADAQGVIVRGAVRVDAAMMDAMPGLRVIARAGVGVDNIDLDAARGRGVRVLNVPNALTETVAEHALALALAARRGVCETATAAREGHWQERLSYRGESIAGSRVTIVGLGSIGRRTADLFRAVGAEVTGWSRSTGGSLVDALDGAEVVSLHVALVPETRGLIGREELARLAKGALVVNTARPAVVDRDAMLAALSDGRVGNYAVDGFEPEPPDASDELLGHPGVIVTPHVAALTSGAFRGLCVSAAEGVVAVLTGLDLPAEVGVVVGP